MATRANVFRFTNPNTIEIAYNHNDGYPEHLGATLKREFTDNTQVADLIGGGNWSYINDDGEVDYYKERPTVIQDDDMTELLFKLANETQSADYAYMWNGEEWFTYKVSTKERFVREVAEDLQFDIDTSDFMKEDYQRKWKKFITENKKKTNKIKVKFLNEGVVNEEEKEDIDSMDDLELNSDYYEAIGDVRDTAMWNSATDLAKEYGFKSYQDYYDKAYDNPDEEINHEHYQEEFLPVARENAEIDLKILDRAVSEFLKYYNITFDIDLKKIFYTEAKDDFGSWQ